MLYMYVYVIINLEIPGMNNYICFSEKEKNKNKFHIAFFFTFCGKTLIPIAPIGFDSHIHTAMWAPWHLLGMSCQNVHIFPEVLLLCLDKV